MNVGGGPPTIHVVLLCSGMDQFKFATPKFFFSARLMCLKGIGIGGSYPTIQAKRNGEGRTLDTISSYVAPSGSHPGIEKFVKPINYNSDDVVT